MGGFRLPKVGDKEEVIDLSKFGGEGEITVHAPRTMDSVSLSALIHDLAKRDGIKIKNDKEVAELSQTKYKLETITHTLISCVSAIEEEGKRPLTEDEIFTLPPELLKEIMEAISRLTAFPLEQTDGTAQK